MTKLENIEPLLLHRSVQNISDFFESIFDNRLCTMSMLQYSDSLYVNILIISHKICPYKSYAHDRNESFDSVNVPHVRVLDIEPGGFHGLEKSLNLPSVLICLYGMFWTVVADENLKLRLSIGVLKPCAGKIHIFTFHYIGFVKDKFLAESDAVEQMPRADFLTGIRVYDPEVLPDPYVIPYPVPVEPCDPFLTDKLPVRHKTIDTFQTENVDKPLYDGFTFHPIGVSQFVQKPEQQRESNPSVGYPQHEDVDIRLSEFPVGTVHGKDYLLSDREEAENHPCYKVKIESVSRKEALKPANVGIPFHGCRHGCGQLVETDSLDNAKGVDFVCHQLYACQIHCFSEMLLHNREDLANFSQVLGIFGSFHGEKSPNFSFKLLNSKDLKKKIIT